jgi:hypothetical protein
MSILFDATGGVQPWKSDGHRTNDEKRAHLIDLKREHLVDQACPQKLLPSEKERNNPSGENIEAI